MVDVARAMKQIGKLTALKFFPADKDGQKAILEIACSMATSTEQIEWLVSQMLGWYNEWPGPREMRAVFCQRWKPASGPDINVSGVFPEGIFPGTEAAGMPQVKRLSQAEVIERRKIERPEALRLLQIAAGSEEGRL